MRCVHWEWHQRGFAGVVMSMSMSCRVVSVTGQVIAEYGSLRHKSSLRVGAALDDRQNASANVSSSCAARWLAALLTVVRPHRLDFIFDLAPGDEAWPATRVLPGGKPESPRSRDRNDRLVATIVGRIRRRDRGVISRQSKLREVAALRPRLIEPLHLAEVGGRSCRRLLAKRRSTRRGLPAIRDGARGPLRKVRSRRAQAPPSGQRQGAAPPPPHSRRRRRHLPKLPLQRLRRRRCQRPAAGAPAPTREFLARVRWQRRRLRHGTRSRCPLCLREQRRGSRGARTRLPP